MSFEVGNMVVHRVHGLAEVVGRESRTVQGDPVAYVVCRVSGELRSDAITLRIPELDAETIGLRFPVSTTAAEGVLDVLRVRGERTPANWSRRYKTHQLKLQSGDICDCAEVVRNLAHRNELRPLANAETMMYRKARRTLVAELAVVWRVTTDDASARVDRALGLDPAGVG